jgi:hypothetical protein
MSCKGVNGEKISVKHGVTGITHKNYFLVPESFSPIEVFTAVLLFYFNLIL